MKGNQGMIEGRSLKQEANLGMVLTDFLTLSWSPFIYNLAYLPNDGTASQRLSSPTSFSNQENVPRISRQVNGMEAIYRLMIPL